MNYKTLRYPRSPVPRGTHLSNYKLLLLLRFQFYKYSEYPRMLFFTLAKSRKLCREVSIEFCDCRRKSYAGPTPRPGHPFRRSRDFDTLKKKK